MSIKRFIKLIIIVFLYSNSEIIASVNNSSDFNYTIWDKKNGLPSNNIFYSLLSKDGFIYLATANGLCRFDGKVFKIYNSSTNKAFTSNAVIRLFENTEGKLFISVSSQGVLIKNGESFSCISENEGLSLNHPSSIVEDEGGRIYIGTFGGGLNILSNNKIKYLNVNNGLSNNSIISLYRDKENRIWIGSRLDEIQYIKNQKLFQIKTPALDSTIIVRKIIEYNQTIYFGTNKGIYILDRDKIVEKPYLDFFKDKNILSLTVDFKNRLWISVEYDGLYYLDHKKVFKINLPFINKNLLINHLNPTEMGLFLSTNQGLINLNEKKLDILLSNNDDENSNIRSVFQINEREILFSSDKNLYRYDFTGRRLIKIKSSNKPLTYFAYEKLDNNRILLGTRQAGLKIFRNGEIENFELIKNLKNNFIRSIKKFNDDILIIGTNGAGVGIINKNKIKYVDKSSGLVDNFIGCIMIDNQKNIWVGTSGGGISIINHNGEIIKNITVNDGLSSGIINSIIQDKDGVYWFGTSAAGLCRFKENKIVTIDKNSGLISNNLKKVIYDGNEYFWITTDNGIIKVKLDELNEYADKRNKLLHYEYINQLDGLVSEEFNAVSDNAGCLTEKYFFAPSNRGLVIINRLKNFTKDEKIITYFDEVSVNNKNIELQKLSELEPDVEVIHFKIGVISYLNSENIACYYKIEGLNKDWILLGNKREILINKIPHGKYQLNVYAVSSTGIVSNTLEIPFLIKPYFWQTNEFFVVSILFIVIMSFLVTKTFIKINYKKKLEKLELENVLINERMRISKDMHDEIGSELTSLSLMFENLKNEVMNNNHLLIKQFDEKLKSLTQLIDEVVWTINPKNDSLENTILYAVDFANELFNNSEIELHIEIPNEIPDLVLKSEIRHNLLLSLKEIMTNAIRHSRAKNFWLKVFIEENKIILELADDGIGIDFTSIDNFSNGINNIKMRIRKINGNIEFENNKPQGTIISISFGLN